MRKFFVSILALLLAAPAFAAPDGDAVANPPANQGVPGPVDHAKNLLSVDGGVDFTTGYFFRGYKEESNGLVAQPYATLSFNLPALQSFGGTDLSITPYVGTWNSIHTDTAGASKSPTNWYETDMLAGVNIKKGDFSFGLVYADYTSPAGNFSDTQEIGLTLGYSDPGLLGVTINPHVGIYRELNRSANFQNAKGFADGSPGTYLEFGIEPSKDITIGTQKITFSVPTTVGLGFDKYYENTDGSNTSLGYGSVGLRASMPLWGSWKLTGTVLYLHDFADSAKSSNSGKTDQLIGTVGVGFSF